MSSGTAQYSTGKSEVTIEVDNYNGQDKVFHPGQRVTGKVVYIIRKDQEEILDASIEFYGSVKTAVTISTGNSSERKRENIRLFHFRKDLYRNNFKFRAQTLSWPFEFKFPDAASHQRRDDSDPSYSRSGLQPLPPSYHHATNSFSKNGEGYVKYKLKAHVNSTKVFGSKTLEKPLILRRRLDYALPDQIVEKKAFPRELWRSRSLRLQKHSFGQKMAHVFGNDPQLRVPSIYFDAVLQLPTSTSLRQRGDMLLYVKQFKTGPTDPESPSLVLGHVRVTLQGLTTLRVEKSIRRDSHHDDGKDTVCSVSLKPSGQAGTRTPLPLDGSVHVVARDWAFQDASLTMTSPVPDFNTWTMTHAHRLKVEMEIVHVETGHVFRLEGKWPCRIYAHEVQLAEPSTETNAPPESSAGPTTSSEPAAEEQLPAYAVDARPSYAPPGSSNATLDEEKTVAPEAEEKAGASA